MLKIHELTLPTGALSGVFLSFEERGLSIVDHEGAFALPDGALEAVMAQFGAPFDSAEPVTAIATLALTPGHSLCHVRHLAGYDVIARDYLVYRTPDANPLCALATTVTAALGHLGRAAHRIEFAAKSAGSG